MARNFTIGIEYYTTAPALVLAAWQGAEKVFLLNGGRPQNRSLRQCRRGVCEGQGIDENSDDVSEYWPAYSAPNLEKLENSTQTLCFIAQYRFDNYSSCSPRYAASMCCGACIACYVGITIYLEIQSTTHVGLLLCSITSTCYLPTPPTPEIARRLLPLLRLI